MDLDKAELSPIKEYELAIEAMLFTVGKSLELRQICLALDINEKNALQALQNLEQRYEKDSALKLIRLENSYQLCTKEKFFDILVRLIKIPKKPILTDAILETLAIVAYKQPITKLEIEKIRAVSSDYSINKLIEYGLIYELARLDAPGRPALFATTEEFLRHFALDSKNSLPGVDEALKEKIEKEVEEEINIKFKEEKSE